jgi:hypothetical protein
MKFKHGLGMFLLLSLAMFCATPSAKADSFDVFAISGTAYHNCNDFLGKPIPFCNSTPGGFAGALEVDATTGAPSDLELVGALGGSSEFGGFFTSPGIIGATPNGTCLVQGEAPIGAYLILCFTTPTPGTLAGFEAGTILPSSVVYSGAFDNSNYQEEFITGGSITEVAVPEPSSLVLIPLGLGALLFLRRRMGHGHSLAI